MKYVILGASAAGVNAARQLRKINNAEDEIVLISADSHIYSRCILHHYLADTRTLDELNFVENDFEKRYNIHWKKGVRCEKIEIDTKQVCLSNNEKESYDALLIATGAKVFIPPIEGLENVKNVIGFRNLEDIEAIKQTLPTAQNIVILGGGLVGVDALTGILHKGKKATLVELADRLLVRQLDHHAANTYSKAYEQAGATFYFERKITSIRSNAKNEVEAVVLDDGKILPCDLLLMTAGIRANIEFLEGSGIEVDRFGLVIDAEGRTNIPDVYGAGDVSGRSPIWPLAVKQGLVAAGNMSGKKTALEDFFVSKSTMNFLDIPTMSLGDCENTDNRYEEITKKERDNYKKIVHKDGKIHGAILQGDLSYAGVLTQLIAHKIDISKVKKPLFDIDYSDFFHVDNNFEYYYEDENNEE